MLDHPPADLLDPQRLQLQAGVTARLAEVLRDQIRRADFRPDAAHGTAERLEALADNLVMSATALRHMAQGKTYGEAMVAALEQGEAP